MTTLDELLDRGNARERTGWALFKTLRLLLLAIGAAFWVLGFTARRIVWPALVWTAAAVKLGWEDGRKKTDADRR